MDNRLGRVYFDGTGARNVSIGVLIGVVLTLVGGALGYHFFWVRPNTVEVNERADQVRVALVEVPPDMSPRGYISTTAIIEPASVRQYLGVAVWWQPDCLRVTFDYWDIHDQRRQVTHRYAVPVDPSYVVHQVKDIQYVQPFILNDKREVVTDGLEGTKVTVPEALHYVPVPVIVIQPTPAPSPSASPTPIPRVSGRAIT